MTDTRSETNRINETSNASSSALDWPMFRQNSRLTGRSGGTGSILTPEITARTAYTSGDKVKLWLEDINLDGDCEYVFVEGGRIRAKNKNGSLIWESDVCNPLIIGFHDLDNLSQEKHIVAVTNLRTLTVFSGATGVILWKYVFPKKTVLLSHNRIKAGKISFDLSGEQITVWPEGDCFGYLFSFENGAANGHLAWRCRGIGIGDGSRYNPNILVGDVHRSGKNSIIVIQHSRIWLIDVETGTMIQEIAGPDMRNYGYAGLFDVDNDGVIELVLVNDAVQLHISVLKMMEQGFVYLWDKFIGYRDYVMKTPHIPVFDIDGDGKQEILYSIGDIGANEWHTEILDSTTGNTKRVIKGARILDCGDISGDGRPVMLLEKTQPSEFVICKIAEAGITELFHTPNTPLTFQGADRPLFCSHTAHRRDAVYLYDIDGDGILELSVIDQHETAVYGVDEAGSFRVKKVISPDVSLVFLCAFIGSGSERLGILFGDKSSGQYLPEESPAGNKKVLYSGTGKVLAEFDCAADVAAQIPIVTDIDFDGRMEIMLGDSVYVMDKRCESGDRNWGNVLHKKWQLKEEIPEAENTLGRMNQIQFLAACDFDRDGLKELLFAGIDAELIMTDSAGNIIWSRKLKENFRGSRILSCSVGRFLTNDRYDILAVVSATADYINECMLINALSGDVVWKRNDGHERGMGPLDGYVTVTELQKDGMDDLIFISSDTLCQIDGKTGIDLYEKEDLGSIMGTRWLGQGHLVLLDVDADGEDEAYLSGIWGLNGGVLKWSGFYWQPRWFDYYGNANPIGTPPRHSHQGIAIAGDKVLAGGPRSDYRFGCYNLANGDLMWTYDLGDNLVSEVCTGDIDGDGFDEFVFGCSDGCIYSLKHNGRLHFKIFTDSLPGSPILADVDEDGLLEILVTTVQGELLVIQ